MIHRVQIGKWVAYMDDNGKKQLDDAIQGCIDEGWTAPEGWDENKNKKKK